MMIVFDDCRSINSKHIVSIRVNEGLGTKHEVVVETINGKCHVKQFDTEDAAKEDYDRLFDLMLADES